MKALCITGADNNTLGKIAHSFYQAGMCKPDPLQREAQVTFASWHTKVAESFLDKKPIGRLWESLASELVLVNIENDFWGWYEEKSVWALDFWAELEPNIHFLLVCNRPEEALEQVLREHVDDSLDTERCMRDWYKRHRVMLDFYLKYPDRCLLIDGQEALLHLNQQLLLVHDYWQLPLDKNSAEGLIEENCFEPQENSGGNILSFVAKETIKNSKIDITSFYLELRAAQFPINNLEPEADVTRDLFEWLNSGLTPATLNTILAEYRAIQTKANAAEEALPLLENRNEKNEEEKQQLLEAKAELEHLLTQAQKDNQLAEQAKADSETRQREFEQLLAQAQKETKVAVEQLGEVRNASERVLLQLHKSQEQQESYFLEAQTLSEEKIKLSKENRELTRQLEQLKEINEQFNKSWLSRFVTPKVSLPLLEFEEITLRHEQVNPDYEHLWITLYKPEFVGKKLDQWSFRISSAAVKPNSFGEQPKLELPEQTDQLLEHWFAESDCGFGSKLELRFALPSAMDMGTWKKVKKHDQQLITALIKELPTILNHLQEKGVSISRAWDDWQKLVADMQRIQLAKTQD